LNNKDLGTVLPETDLDSDRNNDGCNILNHDDDSDDNIPLAQRLAAP
jgi:hypothetical protein